MATLSQVVPEQSQFLQDIARNGSTDEYNTYEDLDTAVLLQSLADFEHPTSHSEQYNPDPPLATKDHDTLQAGAKNDEAGAAQSRGKKQSKASIFAPPLVGSLKPTKRKRRVESDDEEEIDVGFVYMPKTKKKKRRKQDDADEVAKGRNIWGPAYDEDDEGETPKRRNQISGLDARAAGVQSAAALFRKPSAASQKYTRPPMAKVYLQLEVTPPRFLELQAAAKNFMLDPKHPDRPECVGNRIKGDTDMTKLKLFGCVTEFLEDLGWGEKLWGKAEPTPANMDGTPSEKPRRLQWPELKQEIVTLVTPLFRRTVTNERQRLYAFEARKKNLAAKKGSKEDSPRPSMEGTPQPNGDRMSAPSPSPYPAIDPKLNQYRYDLNESSTAHDPAVVKTQTNSLISANANAEGGVGENLKYFVNIMQNGRRVKPKVTLTAESCPDYSSLVKHIQTTIGDNIVEFAAIKVLGPGMWLEVGNNEEWNKATDVVKDCEMLDGQVMCAVEVRDTNPPAQGV
ncbi:hypothetical protein D0Z07_6346 [Hyphodiscus hymeniophilus]|uniref:Uncharacterized protein n=1 Tax=Hyphodiscus hymeniophilus TaxID=353542 RepID=A0A9P6VFP1_9HELO|nr:hypothetical protein D0Z07_6346 [Hyphodiscus hymeniophilus]